MQSIGGLAIRLETILKLCTVPIKPEHLHRLKLDDVQISILDDIPQDTEMELDVDPVSFVFPSRPHLTGRAIRLPAQARRYMRTHLSPYDDHHSVMAHLFHHLNTTIPPGLAKQQRQRQRRFTLGRHLRRPSLDRLQTG